MGGGGGIVSTKQSVLLEQQPFYTLFTTSMYESTDIPEKKRKQGKNEKMKFMTLRLLTAEKRNDSGDLELKKNYSTGGEGEGRRGGG